MGKFKGTNQKAAAAAEKKAAAQSVKDTKAAAEREKELQKEWSKGANLRGQKKSEDAAMKAEKKLLKRVGLFDVYEGDKLEPGHVSYAVSLILQDEEKTLNDMRIEQSVQRILDGIVEATGAQLRD